VKLISKCKRRIGASVQVLLTLLSLALFPSMLPAQAPIGGIEGRVTDGSGAPILGASVTAENVANNAQATQTTRSDGMFHFDVLPVGRYTLTVGANGFSRFSAISFSLEVSQTVRIDASLVPASVSESIIVHSVDSGLDTTTNTLGKTVTEKEVLDLPLNGRNFSQLGLLQTGVAPINAGLLTEGGSLRAGQSYVVNGQRPEANNFLLDGAQNVDRMDGGFAWRIPIDMGAAGVAGRLVTGYLLDRFFAPRVSFFLLLIVCGALVMLAHAHTAAWGIASAGILGFGMGSEIDVTPYLLARYCGLKSLSMLYGCSWTAYAFGAAFGPVIVGKAFDAWGGYAPGLVELLALPCLIAAGLTLLLPAYSPAASPLPQAVPEGLLLTSVHTTYIR
jgi:Carboxypeptidase regulatory-like domain